MTLTRSALTLVVVAGTALTLVAGCSSSGGGKPTDTTTSAPASTATSPSTAPTSPAPSDTAPPSSSPAPDPAAAAIRDASSFVPKYLATLDQLYSDPTKSINDIYGVAVQPESTNEALAIAKFRSANDRQSGAQKLVRISDTSAHLAGLGGTSSNAKYPAIQLTACVDVSAVKVTNANGKPVGATAAPKYLVESLTIVNIKYPSSDAWRVSNAPNKQATTCGAG